MVYQLHGESLAVAIVTFVCSTSSVIGSGLILLCYALFSRSQHFRHALIINLAIADFMNSVNNTTSGFYILVRGLRAVPEGAGCTANGFFSQISVQGTDCSILLIAVVTWLNLRQETMMQKASVKSKILLCLTAWILPVTTAFLGLGKDYYGPVSGNWCWLKAEPAYLRYVLTHGWRFLFIIIEVAIYIHIYISLNKRFREIRSLGDPCSSVMSESLKSPVPQSPLPQSPLPQSPGAHSLPHGQPEYLATPDSMEQKMLAKSPSGSFDADRAFAKASEDSSPIKTRFDPPGRVSERQVSSLSIPARKESKVPTVNDQIDKTEKRIKKMLLMNGYPIAYIILWLPGIANRVAEATGHKVTALALLQASTQLIGVANAINYGLTESMVRQLKNYLKHGKESPRDSMIRSKV